MPNFPAWQTKAAQTHMM